MVEHGAGGLLVVGHGLHVGAVAGQVTDQVEQPPPPSGPPLAGQVDAAPCQVGLDGPAVTADQRDEAAGFPRSVNP